nr:helix-turn-helix domain-containing protein [uncultured Phocaeicola sp.]
MATGTNTTYLSNVVNHYFKCNYKHLLNKYRILHAKHLIDNNECAITELDKRCGFTSRSVFYDAFGKIMGIPPAHYRKRREKAAETCSGFSGTMENSLGKNEIHQQQVI